MTIARMFDRYDENNPPLKCFMTQARWYKESGKFTPKGILLHDTSADNPWLKRYVQPDDDAPDRDEMLALIGKNTNGNDRNHGNKNADSGLNAWIGKLADGRVATLQTGPWDKRPWGCGSYRRADGKKYSLNDTHIQWEICQDAKKDKVYFGEVYEETIALCAYLCKMFNIDPKGTIDYYGIKVPTICCHWDSYNLKSGGDHSDIYDWTAMYDYLGIPRNTVNINDPYNNPINLRIREDIYKAMHAHRKNGWVKEGDKWYYYKDDVLVTSDWIKYKGGFYYVGPDGVMYTGWKVIDSEEYYFYNDGHMAADEWISDNSGNILFLDMTGAQTYHRIGKWKEDKRGKWFEDSAGCYPRSRTVRIDKQEYQFDKDGYLIR